MTKNQKSFDLSNHCARGPISPGLERVVFGVNNGSVVTGCELINLLLSKKRMKRHRAAFLLLGLKSRLGPPGFSISDFGRRWGPQDP
jgi:hypothetical protein